MMAVIEAVERQPYNRGHNGIQCDRCGATQNLDRSYIQDECLNEARSRGWVCVESPRYDLCPNCLPHTDWV